ncbi:F0F1 ATP synthase subunit B' [Myxosarcina sp. GI1]|uniref:F0F1 ATP synthase subunit B' n=1 Tax=Myxosarcina sp. GI1 TaxID=1541065 RepID=UPI00055BC497|nr:F0F1 ATP synthase subunit B' [Myxosarcina sp. GI1]
MIYWTFFIAAAEAAEEAEVGSNLFDIDATLPLMAIQFVLLVIILNALFYKPLGKAIDERADYIRNNFKQARELKEKSESLADQYNRELRDVRRQAQETINSAKADAEATVADKVKAAQQEAQAQKQEAADEIEAQKAEVMQTLEQQVDSLSNQILEKLLGAELVK